MPVSSVYVKALLEKLAEKYNQTPDHTGFGRISDFLPGGITQRYLDDLYRNVKKLLDKGILNTRPRIDYLDIIAKDLGYNHFAEYSNECEARLPESLLSLEGNWWSYVRSNAGNYILKAPVQIRKDERSQDLIISLQGRERLFSGVLTDGAGCAFTFLSSASNKRLGLVLKLGETKNMTVLQGTFCGISNSGEPIAGREVLIREEQATFQEMTWQKMNLEDDSLAPEIREFFALAEKNCLKINNVSHYGIEDLLNANN